MDSMAKHASSRRRTKEHHVSIRVTEAEAAQLERVAAANKLGVATWIRRTALIAADREDPMAAHQQAVAAIAAIQKGITPEQARRLREARERSE
jgi:hypothetical protein